MVLNETLTVWYLVILYVKTKYGRQREIMDVGLFNFENIRVPIFLNFSNRRRLYRVVLDIFQTHKNVNKYGYYNGIKEIE